MPATLTVITGPDAGKRLALDKPEHVLGRTGDLRVMDPGMAREHARLELHADGRWQLVDLGHDGPMYVNDARCRAMQLAHGDVVVCGGVTLRFEQR